MNSRSYVRIYRKYLCLTGWVSDVCLELEIRECTRTSACISQVFRESRNLAPALVRCVQPIHDWLSARSAWFTIISAKHIPPFPERPQFRRRNHGGRVIVPEYPRCNPIQSLPRPIARDPMCRFIFTFISYLRFSHASTLITYSSYSVLIK